MSIRLSFAAALLASAAPAWAATHSIEPGEGAQEALQEALILAEPGDEIVLAAGRYRLTDGLSLAVYNVTVRGAGMEGSVLDFTGQQVGVVNQSHAAKACGYWFRPLETRKSRVAQLADGFVIDHCSDCVSTIFN